MKINKTYRKGYLLFVFALALILHSTPAFGATIHVPGSYPTIQAGINAAMTGDTVLVADGTYTGDGNWNLNFGGKAITVQSENGPSNCIIDCGYSTVGFQFGSGEGTDSVVSGFTIKNSGAGLYAIQCFNSSPTIENCIITGNSGGGIMCGDSSPHITNCTITGNTADYGGAIHCVNSSPTISDCTITDNTTTSGHTIHCNNSSPSITNSTISSNSGGGIGIFGGFDNSSPTITNCIISNNTADSGGGIHCSNASPTITDCTITDNTTTSGYTIHCDNSFPSITNSTISSNSGGGIGGWGDSCLNITDSEIAGNSGAGILVWDPGSCFSTITSCFITNNGMRGVKFQDSSSASINNCEIRGNTVEWGGAGIEFVNSSPTVTNCIISNNTATLDGAGIRCRENSSPTITNCTISNNTASGSGGAIYINDNSSPTIRNSILWADTPEEISIETGTISVTYSEIQGGWPGEGNIDADPLFVGGGDYHLTAGSPSIDTGTSEDAPSTDIEGTTRPHGNSYDMGAYEEFIIPGDIDYGETIDVRDAILALQVCIGLAPTSAIHKEADVNGDNRIGLEEAIHALQVVAGRYNHPPELNPIGNKTIDESSTLTFTVSATDLDEDSLTYSATNLPLDATFDPSTKVFSWTPTYAQSGPYDVTFTVMDIFGALDSETITITVIHVSVVEEWEYILDGGQGNGNMTLTEKQDGTISVEGSWGYGPELTEPHIHRTVEGTYSDCSMTIDGSSFSFTCQGSAQDNSVPPEYPEYMVSPFTLAFNGTTNNGQGSGIYTITFTNPGWTPSISGSWEGTRTSGGGITE